MTQKFHRSTEDVGDSSLCLCVDSVVSVVSGFTLTELLVAVSLLVIVATSSLLVFRVVTQAWRTGELRTERYQQARLLFDLFARELSTCVVSARYPWIGQDASPSEPIKPASVQDAVFFVGALPGRTGLVERGYWVDEQSQLMCHDEEPADGDYVASGTDEPCGGHVALFEVSYFDGAHWLSEWDGRAAAAQAGTVPKAVRITLSVGEQGAESFETIIAIPTS